MAPVGFRLYLITDGASPDLVARVERALEGAPPGDVAVQLRAKGLEGRALVEGGHALRRVTAARGAALLVNDRLDVALAVGADGVHLPSRGLPVRDVRALAASLRPSLLVARSTHTVDEAAQAARDGASFVVLGPVWDTPSKRGLGEPLGLAPIADATRALPCPVFALGGVTTVERARACRAAGARVACIRAVLDAPDAAAAVAALLDG